jgi:uncharacterized protein YhbP (UPF0306 family)
VDDDPVAVAREIIDAGQYMVLATADESGRPWASPVWFAAAGYSEFLWVSSPEADHSRNITVRPRIAIVIFDSQARIGAGQGVYMTAEASVLTDSELERGLDVLSRRSVASGGSPWSPEDVRGDAGIRLYRAEATSHSILARDGKPDHRIMVNIAEQPLR